MIKRFLKFIFKLTLIVLGLILLIVALMFAGIHPFYPDAPTKNKSIYADKIPSIADTNLFLLGNNWLRQNRYGLWEMYIEGDAYNRGIAAGKLSESLVKFQEEVFVSQINKLIPSKRYQKFLLTTIAWFNKNLTKHIKPEFLKEIYGISANASFMFEVYGPAYVRLLNYHAAHDIGHTAQNYHLVGCSSFAVWDEQSANSNLIVGRNFDFYFGDDFAKNKIVEFVAPDSGHKFAFVTWGGMIGVVSGMNDKGLTVTINAGTPEISWQSGTPVSLVTRDILQYASNIDEAVKIASSYRTFVSESFLIGSAADNKAVIIEKRPEIQSIVQPSLATIICTNHFQSKEFKDLPTNIENKNKNATGYRFFRLSELINNAGTIDPLKAATILRDRKGIHNKNIGIGNEKAINQMLAHHSVIFEPAKKIMWVSTPPNNMGPYVAYNLDSIFGQKIPKPENSDIDIRNLEIPLDTFLFSSEYLNFLNYKKASIILKTRKTVSDSILNIYPSFNPSYFETYIRLGDFYFKNNNFIKAKEFYYTALKKEINNKSTEDYIFNQLIEIRNP